MDVWPDFIIDVSYDETTFGEIMAEVANDFPENWRAYYGVASRNPLPLGEDGQLDARHLMVTASNLATAAQVLSDRRLPEERRRLPQQFEERAEKEREARVRLLELLEEVHHGDHDPQLDRQFDELIRQYQRFTPAEDVFRVFRGFLEIEAFERFGQHPSALADRLLKLLEYLVRVESARTRMYLERVARCYVLGLGPELAIMARSVMEAALESLELQSLVDRVRTLRGTSHASLADWVEAATSAGLLDQDERLAADFVRHAGNDAAHAVTGLEPDDDEVLRNLVRVLKAIDRVRPGED